MIETRRIFPLLTTALLAATMAFPSAAGRAGAQGLTILDQEGSVAPNGTPSATSQIVDVAVGPNNTRVFDPATVNISVGDTVRWTWGSSFHSVTSGPPCNADLQYCSPSDTSCGSGILSNVGAVYTHTFTQPGTYSYFCAAHCLSSGMTGTINVAPACTLPPANMVGWFPGDGTARDVAGGNSGRLQGDVTFVAGKVGQAFRFGGHGDLMGNGDRVVVRNAPELQLQDFTIDAWIKRASATIVTNDPDSGSPGGTFFAYGNLGYGFGIFQSTGRLFLTQVGVSAGFSATAVTDTNYHHVAVTKQGGTVTFYLDGVADAPISYNPTFVFNTPAGIAARGDNNVQNAFFGDIDELEIFNRALTAAELQAIVTAGAAGKCKPPQPAAAFSRKAQGTGSFDLDLIPFATAGVECRNPGASGAYQMIVQFPVPVTVTGATILSGIGAVSGFTVNGDTVTVNLTGVTNAQTLVVNLTGVSDGTSSGNVPVAMGVLIGDTSGNGTVNASDVAQTKASSGQPTDAMNFRADVNLSGMINASDIGLVKSKAGTLLPP
ncbi:MAG: LamG-like jellyroll fold domain-containing protein [Chthoniobacterales bacterium]